MVWVLRLRKNIYEAERTRASHHATIGRYIRSSPVLPAGECYPSLIRTLHPRGLQYNLQELLLEQIRYGRVNAASSVWL